MAHFNTKFHQFLGFQLSLFSNRMIMQTVILNSDSKTDIKLLLDLAKKIGIKSRVLSESEIEEFGLVNSMRLGRTNKYVDTVTYVQKLRK
jgi:hypothetical protein